MLAHGFHDMMMRLLAQNFSNYFEEKIDKIRLTLDKEERPKLNEFVIPVKTLLMDFRKVTENEFKKIICDMSKSCQLDPLQLSKMKTNSSQVQDATIKSTDKVINLGVMFDKAMTMESHVNYMCKKAFLNIKNISMIRKSLNKEDTNTAVNALVRPHLDYGDAVLYGIDGKFLRKLQIGQNSAAILIERLRKYD